MPSILDIERFKQVLNELGSEPKILAERSEQIEDIPPPQEGLTEDLRELLQGPAPGEEGAEDFGTGGGGPEEEGAGLPDLDFESLFGESLNGGEPDGGGAAVGSPPAGEEAAGATGGPAGPGGLEGPPEADTEAEIESEAGAAEEELSEELEIPEEFELLDTPSGGAAEEAAARGAAEAGAEAGAGASFASAAGARAGRGLKEPSTGRLLEEGLPPLEDFPAEDLAAGDVQPGADLPEEFRLPAEAEGGAGPEADVEELAGLEDLLQPEGPAGPGAAAEAGAKAGAGETKDGFAAGAEDVGDAGVAGETGSRLPKTAGDDAARHRQAEPSSRRDATPVSAPGDSAAVPQPAVEEAPPFTPSARAEEGPEKRPGGLPAGELLLTEEQFSRLQRTLEAFPRNLKIAVEELIVEKGLAGEPLRLLVGQLVAGAAPSAVARQVSRITGRRIVLPPGLERRTGLAFEAEQRSFAYAFRENILPILGRFLLGAVFLSVLGYAGYRFVYQPVHAGLLYRQGAGLIREEQYGPANRAFDRATRIHPMKRWFFRYADGFIGKKQYSLAEEKYEQLLQRYRGDRAGLLAYALLEEKHLADYPKAVELLNVLIRKDFRDYQALLQRGDAYLGWAEEKSEYYEKARYDYAQLLDYHGQRPELLFRMLRYFVRTDQLEETIRLKRLLESRRGLKVDAGIYAELGGFLLEKRKFDLVEATLQRALEADPRLPESWYHLSRWYRHLGDAGREGEALRSTLVCLQETGALTPQRQRVRIDATNRTGRLSWDRQQYLEAEKRYMEAIGYIEQGQQFGGLGRDPLYGEAYSNLGDLYYYIDRNWQAALEQYRKAEENGLRSPEMGYRMGFALYAAGDFEAALLRFAETAESLADNPNVLYAMGNTLYQLGHYFSAEGYYLDLLNRLETRRARIRNLQPDLNPEHRALAANTMRVYNNLGVTLGRLANQGGDRRRYSQALANLTFSSEYFDLLRRDPATLARGDTKNLAYLNQQGLLYPQAEFELQLYNPLPPDTESPEFSE